MVGECLVRGVCLVREYVWLGEYVWLVRMCGWGVFG